MDRRAAASSFLAVSLLAAVPSWAQVRPPSRESVPRTFSIRGAIRHGDDNHAMEMVKVDLKRLAGEIVSSTFTRSNGEFEFVGLPQGVYYIVVEERGYEPIRESIEIFNSSRQGVYLFLKPPLEIRAVEAGRVVSARELSIPRKAHGAMQKGLERLYDKNDSKGSLTHFQRAVTELPTYYEAYHQMGVAYMRLGEVAEAEQALRKSIEVSENRYPVAHIQLAALLSNNQRFAEAEPFARRGLELGGDTGYGHFELARALLGLNQVDAAEKSAVEARRQKPELAQLHLVLANIHMRKHNYPALLLDLDAYLKIEPAGPMSDQARAMREKLQQGLANAQSAPATSPPKP